MFRYVKLRNYKSLINVDVNLCSKKDTPRKMVLIYGENGVGKSNFVSSFYTLFRTVMTKTIKEKIEKTLNYDMMKQDSVLFKKSWEVLFEDIEAIIQSCKTIGSTENMVLEFGIKVNGRKGIYRIETDDSTIVSERLEYICHKNQTTFFAINKQETYLNEKIFKNFGYRNDIYKLVEKNWGKHSFLSLLLFEVENKPKEYIKKYMSMALYDVVLGFSELCVNIKTETEIENILGHKGSEGKKIVGWQKGRILLTAEEELNKVEKILDIFFTSLYSDIKQVYYKKTIKENRLHYELWLKKIIYNNIIDMNFDLEATGMQHLLKIFPFLVTAAEGGTAVIDEIDNGIHDVLVTTLLENLNGSITGQLIVTTHNTMLLESAINKDCMYIIAANDNAKKEIVPLARFEDRMHPNLNMRKRYLSGMYSGIPTPKDIDFSDLVKTIK